MEYRFLNGRKRATGILAASLAGVFALGTAATVAQDTSSDTSRPASIHLGTCDSPGDVVAELRDLVVMFDDDDDDDGQDDGSGSSGTDSSTPVSLPGSGDDGGGDDTTDDQGGDDTTDDGGGDDNADDQGGDDDSDDGGDDDSGRQLPNTLAFQSSGGGEFVGADDASVVEGSEDSDVDVDLATLLAEPHVIAVFESDGSDTIIACGSIGGFVSADDDDDLAVGLRQQNDSGFAGVALLDDDDDDNELDVDVYIARDAV